MREAYVRLYWLSDRIYAVCSLTGVLRDAISANAFCELLDGKSSQGIPSALVLGNMNSAHCYQARAILEMI